VTGFLTIQVNTSPPLYHFNDFPYCPLSTSIFFLFKLALTVVERAIGLAGVADLLSVFESNEDNLGME
jgi:NADH:ubiquinone oxidoreductase subunit K